MSQLEKIAFHAILGILKQQPSNSFPEGIVNRSLFCVWTM